jgi:branched-chain amino acid transport system substrate-binding protein
MWRRCLCAASDSFAVGKVGKIGVLAPLTGGSAADGEEMVRGLTLAVEAVNAKGGVAGYTFEIAQGDTRNQQSDAVTSAVERLLGDSNLHMIFTGYASGSNFEIEQIAEAGVPTSCRPIASKPAASCQRTRPNSRASGR